MTGLLHHELTTATVTRPVQDQVIQHSNMNRAEVHKDPPLTEGLLAVDIFCGIDRQFSSEVWPQKCYCVSPLGWSYTHAHIQGMKIELSGE